MSKAPLWNLRDPSSWSSLSGSVQLLIPHFNNPYPKGPTLSRAEPLSFCLCGLRSPRFEVTLDFFLAFFVSSIFWERLEGPSPERQPSSAFHFESAPARSTVRGLAFDPYAELMHCRHYMCMIRLAKAPRKFATASAAGPRIHLSSELQGIILHSRCTEHYRTFKGTLYSGYS